jgi:hypothetical protein
MLTIHRAKSITPVGSYVTCIPPVLDTDRDYLVLVEPGYVGETSKALEGCGWLLGGSVIFDDSHLPADERFSSYKKGNENLILTDSEVFHRRFLAASSIAKRFNLLDKVDRIALFQAVLYGNAS